MLVVVLLSSWLLLNCPNLARISLSMSQSSTLLSEQIKASHMV
jgi:hypothetical protein